MKRLVVMIVLVISASMPLVAYAELLWLFYRRRGPSRRRAPQCVLRHRTDVRITSSSLSDGGFVLTLRRSQALSSPSMGRSRMSR